MQRKLKSVFRSSSKKKASDQSDRSSSGSAPNSPQTDRRGTSLEERNRPRTSSSSQGGARGNSRSRPLSSAYDSRRVSNASGSQPVATDYAQHRSSEQPNESIANDYKAYLPALSPVDDSHDEYMTLGGDRRLINGESDGRHEEDVADRNIDRYRTSLDMSKRKPLPATPGSAITEHESQRKYSGAASNGSAISTVGSTATGPHEKNQRKQAGFPSRAAQEESRVGWNRRRPRGSESDDDAPRSPPEDMTIRQILSTAPEGTHAQDMAVGIDGQRDIERQIEQMLDGVVDLNNTVDEDKEVTWAPGMLGPRTRRPLKDIHKPVYDIEVLPPRHWIPNPDGEGLIEISADELPSRTGKNRRWKIVMEEEERPAEQTPSWRTEPDIVEGPTTMTEEGFERKETTIIHPPTLQDMTDYAGLVQPVHFDHKTGKRWLGEITTMHQLRSQLGQVVDPESMDMRDMAENLPQVLAVSELPELSKTTSVSRKPVTGPVPAQLGQLGARTGIAV
ncbi:hypothetical protein EK21DRAFT_97173 [Setomelanomma holmii]|uniref:Uncharacterized protein n=1 Tax=Setomelanomma holmii TaxID=210430 RepID=A0A9P4HH94_9PLEO|nr:hypothetical protein EK21DRAFT_97173 [Setomelanomma holmii]